MLGLFVVVLVYFSSSGEVAPKKQDAAAGSATPVTGTPEAGKFILGEFHRSETKNGRTVWEVKAKSGQYYPESSTAKLNGATLWFYKKEGELVRLESGSATLYLDGNSLVKADTTDGVTLNYNDKLTLTTDYASFDKEKNIVHAPGQVLIKTELLDISGESMQANVETQEVTIERKVKTVIRDLKIGKEKNNSVKGAEES